MDGLQRRRFADPASCETGDPFARGTTFDALYWVDGVEVDGEHRWWVAANGDRVWVGGTRQKPDDA